jgi:protein CpxP
MNKTLKIGLIASAFILPVAFVAHGASNHSWGGHGKGGHGMKRMCNPDRIERIEGRQALVARFIGIEENQADEWNRLKDVRIQNAQAMLNLCATMKEQKRDRSYAGKLAKKEKMLEVKLANVQRLRPAVEAFEAVLSDEQKSAMKELRRHMKGHGRKHGWRKHSRNQENDNSNRE